MAALVTCGDCPSGRAMAVRLGHRGLDVVLQYTRDKAGALETAARVKDTGVVAHTVQMNLDQMDLVERLVDRSVDLVGQLTVLINTCADDEHNALLKGQGVSLQTATSLSQVFAKQGPPAGIDVLQEVVAQGCIINVIGETRQDDNGDDVGIITVIPAFEEFTKVSARALAPTTRVNAILYRPTAENDVHSEGDLTTTLDYLIEQPAVTGQLIHIRAGAGLV